MDIIKLNGAFPANLLDVGGGASKEKVRAGRCGNPPGKSLVFVTQTIGLIPVDLICLRPSGPEVP